TPRARPYFSVGPSFSYGRNETVSTDNKTQLQSGWAVGINGGGGVILFANNKFGARIDLRYYPNFGSFYELNLTDLPTRTLWNDLHFFRLFFGGTVVL